MTLEELIARYRIDADDKLAPYFVSDEELIRFFDEAQREAAVRRRLLHESDNADVCVIQVEPEKSHYPLHQALYEIDHSAFRVDGQLARVKVRLVSTEWLDANVRDWRDATGDPEYAVQNDTEIRLVPTPERAGELLLEGFRLPLAAFEEEGDEPEIHAAHHIHLVQWVLHKVFAIPDAELFDLERSARAEAEFTRYFGPRPDADLRRDTREDVPHHVVADWP